MSATGPRVLLTGGRGFVGRQLLRLLVAQGYRVRLLVRTPKAPAAMDLAGEDQAAEAVESCVAVDDLFALSRERLRTLCEGVDTVLHAAWFAEPGKYLSAPENLPCLAGTLQLFAAAREAGVRRFVGLGTCFEYDLSHGYLSTATPLKPETPYALAKATAFQTCAAFADGGPTEFAWCRLFYLYGEGEDPRRLVPYIHQQLRAGEVAALTRGLQVRDYLDVADAARDILSVMAGRQTGAVNICSGQPQTVRALALSIAERYGRPDLLHFGARADNAVDPPVVVGVKT